MLPFHEYPSTHQRLSFAHFVGSKWLSEVTRVGLTAAGHKTVHLDLPQLNQGHHTAIIPVLNTA